MRAIKKVTVVAAIVTAGALGFAAPALADTADATVTVQPGVDLPVVTNIDFNAPGVLNINGHTNATDTVHLGLLG
ncbi:hypothetical protein [Nocardia terpenica]|uniref:DUF320 domain-containing protein n=1 Tax=Nocardia terpenica TaxID=455432 RepID=A0A6G9Z9T8_9NOCA|nr:hypothetical protein [Nocardia terpenica]QIS22127.1 hypothetical protein F6W96_31070 [Nocardia terpenica]